MMENVIPNLILLFTLMYLEIDLSEEIRWKTEPRTMTVCKGNTTDLIWDFDEDGNRISKLEWYFNDKPLIWVWLDTEIVKVEPSYQERIEILGKSWIRLKNISLDDEGRFTLFPVLSMATSESIQTISLTVIEPPPDKCKCKTRVLGQPLKYACEFSSSDCGRPHMSVIWKRSSTLEVLGEGNYITLNSSFHNSEIICCPQGIAMDCVGEFSSKFCTPIPLQNDESLSEVNKNTQQRETTTKQVPYSMDTDCKTISGCDIAVLLIISLTVTFVGTTVSFVTFRIMCRILRKHKDLVAAMQEILTDSMHNEDKIPLLLETAV